VWIQVWLVVEVQWHPLPAVTNTLPPAAPAVNVPLEFALKP
jgi:hypothetical protein